VDIGPERLGVWLLGRRDPDDYYAASEIGVLGLLAGQAGVGLANIEQTSRLHGLYQDDIDRTELERARLARDLHDVALNHLATIALYHDAEQMPAIVRENFEAMDASLRDTIAGLRPAMLNYGLGPGLEGLVSQLQSRGSGGPAIELVIDTSDVRLPLQAELHLYRIVQQAAENAIRHAEARHVTLSGQIQADRVRLRVEDNGRGFNADGGLDLPAMLARGHHGLVGMFERAALIGATLTIATELGRGTNIEIFWQPAVPP
jgi:two-component system sensor histidine kinase DegS